MAIASPRAGVKAFPLVQLTMSDEVEHRRRLAEVVNGAMLGKTNTTGSLTLTASQATTTLTDTRLTATSVIMFMPITANAAAEIGAGGMYVSAQANGSATVTHANNAQADRDFRYAFIA